MTILKEVSRDVQDYPDDYIERQMQKYQDRKYNICIKMEKGIYSQKQADKNYERASKIYTLFFMEKNRRMLEQDKIIREVLKSMQGQSMGVLTR
jgi:hypothetical protein